MPYDFTIMVVAVVEFAARWQLSYHFYRCALAALCFSKLLHIQLSHLCKGLIMNELFIDKVMTQEFRMDMSQGVTSPSVFETS